MGLYKVQKQGRNDTQKDYSSTENCGKERLENYSTSVA